MDGPRGAHAKWSSQTEKNKYHIILLTCGIWNMIQMNLFRKQTYRYREQIYDYQRRKEVEEGKIKRLGLMDKHYYQYK